MTVTTMTKIAAAPTAASLSGNIRVILKPVDVLVSKILACDCFDATQKQEIKVWQKSFSKNYPEVPKEESVKEDAARALLDLLVIYIKYNTANPELMFEFQTDIEDLLKTYLPLDTDIEAVITDYAAKFIEDQRMAMSISWAAAQEARVQEIAEKAWGQLDASRRAVDASIDEQFQEMDKLINAFKKTRADKTVQVEQRVKQMYDKLLQTINTNNSQGAEQGKIVAAIDQIALSHKKNAEATQNLAKTNK